MDDPDHVLNWLLEPDTPPVQYLTLRNLCGYSEEHPDVEATRSRLMDYEVTQAILAAAPEFWGVPDKAYWKYTGRYWQVIFLGQFLADGRDPRLECEILRLIEGRRWITNRGGQCLTANMLTAFMRLGFSEHPVVVNEAETLAARLLTDKGVDCAAMLYSLLAHCYMALPKLLLCFTQIRPQDRSSVVLEAIDFISNELLENRVFVYVPGTRKGWQDVLALQPKKAELPEGQTVKAWIEHENHIYLDQFGLGNRDPKPGWKQFGFPLHYNSDILEATVALAGAGIPMDVRLRSALDVIRSKQQAEGTWLLDNSLNGKMWADVEEKGKPSKWITYFARYVLNHFGDNP